MSSTNTRDRGGFHSILAEDHPYIFIDSCMQIWPDSDFANAHRHGVTGYAVTAWDPHAGVAEALQNSMEWHRIARLHPNLVLAETAGDIRTAKGVGKAALILAAQGGDFIEGKLHRVEAFWRLGLRVMLLAYNQTNLLCDGCLDRTASGLTRFGQSVVDECNRVGIVLDCTHTGKRSTLEIIDRSQNPCIFTHSNPSALVPNPRNIDDEQIKSCAARGGVIGLVAWGPLVMKPGTDHWPTVDDFIHHIDHVVNLTGGTDHIGIGTDMSLGTYPDHWHDPWGEPDFPDPTKEYNEKVTGDIRSPKRYLDGFSDYPEVVSFAEKLAGRGYSDLDVKKILGENYLRIFTEVWKAP